ncbi:hypothetical protein Pla175_43420 [Pirellulimonas nuda]|uniref:Uncharacterized protein n=1 Tax=Pirellulimonas nuda TaxID=2528009 RepID=A0A518DHH7_9BACT|nr:hypothetical protein Pla175_43420 [Pirellulimonas nuda]
MAELLELVGLLLNHLIGVTIGSSAGQVRSIPQRVTPRRVVGRIDAPVPVVVAGQRGRCEQSHLEVIDRRKELLAAVRCRSAYMSTQAEKKFVAAEYNCFIGEPGDAVETLSTSLR